jgi:lipid A biosynthesis acyltransferase
MIRSVIRRAVVLLASRWPHPLYGVVEQLACVTAPLTRQGVTVRRLRAVFSHLSQDEAQRAARELRCSKLKSRALGVALSGARGEPVYPPVAVDAALTAIRGPAILATFHADAVGALGEMVRRLPGEVAALHRMQWTLPSTVVGQYHDDTELAGAAAFYRALSTLRRGGCVLLLVDGARRAGLEVSLLGRATSLWRGAFALARMTGAPIIPLVVRWNGALVEVICGETIAPVDDEATMAHAMAARLERHLLGHPADIGDQLLDQLSRADVWASPRSGATSSP